MTVEERNRIVERNLGLVHTVVNRMPIPLHVKEDAEQVGYMALTRAVDGHDPRRGTLATYAIRAIENAIRKYVSRYSGVVSRPTRDLAAPMEVVYMGADQCR